MEYTKTELHTHLVGMLPAEEFVDFILLFGIEKIVINDTEIFTKELLNEPYYSMIQITKPVDYKKMTTIYQDRTEILKSVVNSYKNFYGLSSNQAQKIVYTRLINASLRSLIRYGIKYVEISYSFPDRISAFIIDEDIKDKIDCRFLLSTDRGNPLYSTQKGTQTFESAAKNLVAVLKTGKSVGFDVMGEEGALKVEELDYSNEFHSFKRKLELIISVLLKFQNTTLRIHSGETSDSINNTITILEMIEEIQKDKGITIPPPEIRIGHGLYFDPNTEYIKLLKKLKCVIEINASSNIMLGNIDSLEKIPYKFYLSHGIPIVTSTDAHGVYSTNPNRENRIAFSMLDNEEQYQKIIETDLDILRGKGR